jgi:hypothetical protein
VVEHLPSIHELETLGSILMWGQGVWKEVEQESIFTEMDQRPSWKTGCVKEGNTRGI